MLTHLTHDFFYGWSLALNTLLIALIVTKTPSYLRCYSFVLLYLAIVEITTAISSLLVFKKVLSNFSFDINAVGGVCRHWDPRLCFCLNAIQLAGIAHHAMMIGFCSCYRYYVIAFSRDEPKRRNVLMALVLIHLPTIAIYTNFAFAPLLKDRDLERAMNESHPEYHHVEREMLLVTRRDFSVFLALFWIQFLIVPVCIIVIISTVRINSILASLDHMSAHSKMRHAQILKGLLCQALLPALYAVAIFLYRAARRNVISSEEFGHLTPLITSLLTALSPLFTIIFTLPYRDALCRPTERRTSNSSITATSPIFVKNAPVAV